MAEAIPETIQDNPRIGVTINICFLKISSILHTYDDIFDVRQKVFDVFNIALEEQIIKHRGRVIGNEEIIYTIYKDPSVDIEWKNPLSLIIKSNNLTQGGTFYVSVPRSVKIFSLLEIIGNKIKLKCYEFYLVWSGTTLDYNNSISDYDIKKEDVLQVHVRGAGGMTVNVIYRNRIHMIPFSPDQCMSDFKKIVCYELDIKELRSLCIVFRGLQLMDENKLMSDYDIQSGNVLNAIGCLRGGGIGVRCMYKSNWMVINFESVDSFSQITIRELKEKISKEIEKSLDKFTIKYNRTEFTDLNKTLKQYLIDNEMTLDIEDKY